MASTSAATPRDATQLLAVRTAEAAAREDAELILHTPTAFPARAELRRFWDLTMTLTRTELKRRYLNSTLGYLWTILRPLLLFAVIYAVVSKLVQRGAGVEHYPLYLLMSLVLWNFFAEATGTGVSSLLDQEGVLRKINFPRLAVPLSLGLTSAFHLLPSLGVVVVFLLVGGITPTLGWLAAIPLILAFLVFTMGVATLLATLFVRMRDLGPIWEVGTQVLFWASPVIYTADSQLFDGKDTLEKILVCSPISATFTEMRHLVLQPSAPSTADMLGSTVLVLIPLGIAVAIVVGALWLFARRAPSVAEEL